MEICVEALPHLKIYTKQKFMIYQMENKQSIVIPEPVIERMPTAELSHDQLI